MGDDQNIETSQLWQTTCNYADIEIPSKQSFFLWILLGLRNDGHPPGCRVTFCEKFSMWKNVRLQKKKKQIAPTTLMTPHQVSAFIFGGQKKPVFFRWRSIPGALRFNHLSWHLWESSSNDSQDPLFFFQQTWPFVRNRRFAKKKVTAVIKCERWWFCTNPFEKY